MSTSALEFLRDLFSFRLHSRGSGQAFIELGDQFIALFEADKTFVLRSNSNSSPTFKHGSGLVR
jgi:hypothetical protein